MKMITTLTLEVEWDDEAEDNPSQWAWGKLIDGCARVVNSGITEPINDGEGSMS